MVTQQKHLRENGPENGGDVVQMTPFASGSDIASVRRSGGSLSNVPYVLSENASHYDEIMKNRRESAFDLSKAEDRKRYSEVIKASFDDKQKASELAAYRLYTLTNDIMPSKFAMAAFLSVDLSPDELPLIERPRSKNFQRFAVRSVSYDGGHLSDQWQTTKAAEQFELETIGTDKIEYPITDIRTGDVSAVEGVNEAMRYDMDMKVDNLALTNMDAASAASGLQALMSIHPDIDVANIPDLNYLDLNGSDAGLLTLAKLKTILNHIALLQSAYEYEGLQLKTVFLSPQNVRDSWDFTSLVANTGGIGPKDLVPEAVRESIFNTGSFMNAFGYRMNWVPNSRIAKGRMYFVFNKPIGWMFTKKSMDRIIRWDETNSPDHAERNQGEVLMKRVLAFVRPDVWAHRIVIVDV